jgi:hypothetical protein
MLLSSIIARTKIRCECRGEYGRSSLDQNFGAALVARCRGLTGDGAALHRTSNHTAIQRLVSRQDAICRELFERAIATAFT